MVNILSRNSLDVNLTYAFVFKYSLLFGLRFEDILIFAAAHHSEDSQRRKADSTNNEEEKLELSPEDISKLIILNVIISIDPTDWRDLIQVA